MNEPLTKEQIKAQKDKEAIASMKLARDNMQVALSRIDTLERRVANLGGLIDDLLKHIPQESYAYNSAERNRDKFSKRKSELMNFV